MAEMNVAILVATNPFLADDDKLPPSSVSSHFVHEAEKSWQDDIGSRNESDVDKELAIGSIRSSESAAEIIAQLKQNAQALSSATCSKSRPPTGSVVRPPTVTESFKAEQQPQQQAPPPSSEAPPAAPTHYPTLPRKPSIDESPPAVAPRPPPPTGGWLSHGRPTVGVETSIVADQTHGGGVYLDTPFSNTDASYSNASSPAVRHRPLLVDRHEMTSSPHQQQFNAVNPCDDPFSRRLASGATCQEQAGMMSGGAATPWTKDSGSFKSSTGSAIAGGGLITQEKGGKIDLESTIANLAENLTIDRGLDGKSPKVSQRVGLTPNVNANPVSSTPSLPGGGFYTASAGGYGAAPMPTSYMPYAAANQNMMMHGGNVAPMMGAQVPIGFYGQQQHPIYSSSSQPFAGIMPVGGGAAQSQPAPPMQQQQTNGSFWSSTVQAQLPPQQQQQNAQTLQDLFGAL